MTRPHGPLILPDELRARLDQAAGMIETALGGSSMAFGVAACDHGAGTTSVARYLASALGASRSEPVCLVEANLRSPALAAALGLRDSPGWAELINGEATLDAVAQSVAGESLSVIVAGKCTTPGGPVARPALADSMARLREKFPVVVCDCSPLLRYPDSVALARGLDGMVMVIYAEHDKEQVVQNAAQVIRGTGARLLGAILNRKPMYIPRWLYRLL